MTTLLAAPPMAGAFFAGPRKGAQTALAAAVAVSLLLHLGVLAIRLSSGSGGTSEPIVLRPLAVRLITSPPAAIPTVRESTSPVPVEAPRAVTPPVVEPRESPAPTTAPPVVARPSPAEREPTSRPRPVAGGAQPSPAPDARPASEAPATPSAPVAASTTAYRAAAGLDPPPRPLDDIVPEFPAAAGTRGGTVVLRLLLSETGAVDKIEVVRSNPPGLFDAAALAAFGAARYSPGFLAGTPVRSQIMFEVEFAPQAREGGASSRGY